MSRTTCGNLIACCACLSIAIGTSFSRAQEPSPMGVKLLVNTLQDKPTKAEPPSPKDKAQRGKPLGGTVLPGWGKVEELAAPMGVVTDEETLQPIPQTDEKQSPVKDLATDPGKQSLKESVIERYPNGSPKIVREVTLDEGENYVNHGHWKMLDPQGVKIAEGEYRFGKRHGRWVRWHAAKAKGMFRQAPFTYFRGPFVSQVTYNNGSLDGVWTIHDANQRKVVEWRYSNNQRDGVWLWLLPSGAKMREVPYEKNVLDGTLQEWGVDGRLTTSARFQNGRQLVTKVEHFPKTEKKKSETSYLLAPLELSGEDQWWEASLAQFVPKGVDEKHGAATIWGQNGEIQMRGAFKNGLEHGQFTWWYSNGQKSLEGRYEHGKQIGNWTWWHENGLKATVGAYAHGNPIGDWKWWRSSGKLAQKADMSNTSDTLPKVPGGPQNALGPQVADKPSLKTPPTKLK